ncbi:MAG: hypothetical protein KF911_15610 [Pseudomonadales bacterium]|nr:hypothetical protein [Pseudomonadales bacterium]
MKFSTALATVTLVSAAFLAGCGKDESAADKAIEGTKDALDLREYEQLKDAAEDARDALEDAADRVSEQVEATRD